MTSTDRLAEMAAEIERLNAEDERLRNSMLKLKEERAEFLGEVHLLRSRIIELEAIITVGHGTMGTLEPDEPATITHGHPPSAPPHDE